MMTPLTAFSATSANLATISMGRHLVKTVPQASSQVQALLRARLVRLVTNALTVSLILHVQQENIAMEQQRTARSAGLDTSK